MKFKKKAKIPSYRFLNLNVGRMAETENFFPSAKCRGETHSKPVVKRVELKTGKKTQKFSLKI